MIALKNILCPIDLSPASDAALRYAVALAQAYEAKLYLCHCTDELPADTEAKRAEVSELFRDAVTTSVRAPIDESTRARIEGLLIQGDPRTELPRVAAQRRIDLIVMRSRRRPVAAALLGSTAEAVCRTAPCSVLVTHPDEREWTELDAGKVQLQRILTASDFSHGAAFALGFGLSLAQEYQAELDLLHVVAPTQAFALAVSDAALKEGDDSHQATLRLRAAVPAEAYLWCKVHEIIREGVPHREILKYAQEHPVDLLCLGAHGTSGPLGTLFGSNTDRVMRQAPCPVLIARPFAARPLDKPLTTLEQRLW